MTSHANFQVLLAQGILEPTGQVMALPGSAGFLRGWGTTVGNGVENWAPGAIFQDYDAAAGQQFWVNEGSATSASWKRMEAGNINLLDNETFLLGTGPDVQMLWDASRLILGPPNGFWADCPLIGYANGHTLAYEFFDDFMDFAVGDATSRWTLGTTQGTAILGSAEASNTPGPGGYASIGTAGTSQYDYASIKPCSTNTGAPFKIAKDSGKKLWFECRIMVSSIVDANIMVGLFNEDVDDMSVDATGAESVQDGVYHRTIVATETEIDFAVNKDTTETEVKSNGGTLGAATAITLGFKFDGVSTLTSYVNGTAEATTSEVDATNFPSDQGLTPAFFIKDAQSGGAAKRLYVDWVKVVQLR